MVFAGFAANAQLTKLDQSFYLNLNLPTGQFNDDITRLVGSDDDVPLTRYNAGKAAIAGVGVGYRASYRFDVGVGEVSPFVGIDLNWNSIQGDLKDKYDDGDGSKINYINIPVMVGINYRYQLNDIFTPFAEFGIGPDFLFITKESSDKVTYSDATTRDGFKLKYKPTGAFAWELGVGSFFGEHVSAGLYFQGYGKHTIKYGGNSDRPNWYIANGYDNDTKAQKRNINLLSLRIGFHF